LCSPDPKTQSAQSIKKKFFLFGGGGGVEIIAIYSESHEINIRAKCIIF